MATYIKVCCPHCQRSEVKRHGKTGEGKQRYLCQNRRCHVKTFLLSEGYTYQGCRPHIDTQIIVQTLRAGGIRDIAKTVQISCVKVINTIKSKAATIKKANWDHIPDNTHALLVCVNAQLDEQWSCVGNKKNQR